MPMGLPQMTNQWLVLDSHFRVINTSVRSTCWLLHMTWSWKLLSIIPSLHRSSQDILIKCIYRYHSYIPLVLVSKVIDTTNDGLLIPPQMTNHHSLTILQSNQYQGLLDDFRNSHSIGHTVQLVPSSARDYAPKFVFKLQQSQEQHDEECWWMKSLTPGCAAARMICGDNRTKKSNVDQKSTIAEEGHVK